MARRTRRATAAILISALWLACPGLAPYQALAGVVEGEAAQPVPSAPSGPIAGASAAPGAAAQMPALDALPALDVEAGLRPEAAASAAAAAEGQGAAVEPPGLARPAPQGLVGGRAGERSGAGVRADAPQVDFDHAGAAKKASAAVEAPEGPSAGAGLRKAGVPGRRYYVYETRRDYKITAPAKALHFGSIAAKMAGKLWLISLWNKTVAVVAGAAFVLIPPKLMVFLRLYSGIHLTFASPALARHAPVFADRREVLAPHEELGQIPGVLRTIDVSERHDSAEGFSYFGSFLNRRVEEHRTLVMADVSLPAEIRAQDGGLLGRLTEVGGKDTLVLRARTRVGVEAAAWRRSVEALFSGDVMDAETASEVRAGLDERWLRSAAVKVLTLAAVSGGLALGVYLPFEYFGIPGAHTYAELVGLIYFIVAGVFDHAGGPRIFRKHFFQAQTPRASRWSRLKAFLAEAWHESKEHHAHAVTVALETPAGERPLGDIARGGGAHALAGNGLRRQLASLVLPAAWNQAKPGLGIRAHDTDGRLTTLVVSGLVFTLVAATLAVSGHVWAAFSALAALAAVVVVIDPFTSKGAAAYDARMRSSSIPWGQGAFVLSAVLAALILLPAPSALAGAAGAGGLAAALASMYGSLKHVFNPRVNDVRTPRSTPALASESLSR